MKTDWDVAKGNMFYMFNRYSDSSEEEETENCVPRTYKTNNKRKAINTNKIVSDIPPCPNLTLNDIYNNNESIQNENTIDDIPLSQSYCKKQKTSCTKSEEILYDISNMPVILEGSAPLSEEVQEDSSIKKYLKQIICTQATSNLMLQDIKQRISRIEDVMKSRAPVLTRSNDSLIAEILPLHTIETIQDFDSLLHDTEEAVTQFMANQKKIINIWKAADAVTFDVDSTVIKEEGIDELANFCGKGDQIHKLTKQAMQGDMTFQQSLFMRLQIINPSLTQVKEFLDTHQSNLSSGIKELVSDLQARGKEVFLISGGFRCLISPVASQLKIPEKNIYANRLKFYFTGEYAGFDENQPTSRSGGKAEVIKHLKETKGYKTIVHIGDGSTDLEACPPADAFIGFGGNVIRESVKSHAEWFVMNFDELRRNL